MERILSLIEHYGYLVVLFGVMLESTGVPLPGETILLAAGVLVQRGHLDLWDAIVFGILGAVMGDQIGYWVGREEGRRFVLRWGRYLFISPERLARAEAFFGRHGGKAVFLARFFSGLRVFGALVAGTSRMRWGTFLIYNVLGGAVWVTGVVLLGYFLGSSLGLVERWLGRATLVLVALLAVVVAFYLGYRWAARNRARLAGWGEAGLAYPPVARLRTRYDAQLRWLLRRLTPGQYLGLHLTVGLLAAAGCLWLFGGVVEDLITGDPLVRFDRALDDYLHSHATPNYFLPRGHRLRLHGGHGAPWGRCGGFTRLETPVDPALDLDRGGGRKRPPQLAVEGALPKATAPLRAPPSGRDQLLVPKRPRHGVLRRLRDACLPGRALAEELGGSHGGGLRCGACGGSDRLQSNVPGRSLLQRRRRRVRRWGSVAERPDDGSGDDTSWGKHGNGSKSPTS
jgi:membrane protein DedA with SNARE-associated domain